MTAPLNVAEPELLPDPIVDELCRLHSEVKQAGQTMLEKAIRIGELLSKQREHVRHGGWVKWVEANLPFNDSQARKYVSIYAGRDELRNRYSNNDLTVSDAYRLVTAKPTPPPAPEPPEQVEVEIVEPVRTKPAKRDATRVNLAAHPIPTKGEIDGGEAYLVARRLLELWRVADRTNRGMFLSTVVTSGRHEIKQALRNAAKKPAPEKLI